jgi:hypothetical protein
MKKKCLLCGEELTGKSRKYHKECSKKIRKEYYRRPEVIERRRAYQREYYRRPEIRKRKSEYAKERRKILKEIWNSMPEEEKLKLMQKIAIKILHEK